MNELQSYNPDDYHINLTSSVYVTLDASTLRLQRPKTNVPKRAMWDEQPMNPTFIHQRHFDLKGSHVFLEPAGLVRKRLWSKKYPICIALENNGKNKQENKQEISGHSQKPFAKASGATDPNKDKKLITQGSLDEAKIKSISDSEDNQEKKLVVQRSLDEGKLHHPLEQQESEESMDLDTENATKCDEKNDQKEAADSRDIEGFEVVSKEACDNLTLYFFARTGREKEEWYRRFMAASMGHPWPTRMSDLLLRMHSSASSPVLSPSSPEPRHLQKRHSSSSLEPAAGAAATPKQHQRHGSTDSLTSPTDPPTLTDNNQHPATLKSTSLSGGSCSTAVTENQTEQVLCRYLRDMSRVLPAAGKTAKPISSAAASPTNPSIPRHEKATTPSGTTATPGTSGNTGLPMTSGPSATLLHEPEMLWVNTFVSRFFWDFLLEQYWGEKMREKIQRKLSKLHVSI